MPREIEIARRLFRQIGNPKARQDAIEIAPVQRVELAEGHAAGTHVLHGGLVLVAPSVGEREPVELMAGGSEDALGLARDAGSKIDQSAEDVEEQRLDRHGGLVGQNQLKYGPRASGDP